MSGIAPLNGSAPVGNKTVFMRKETIELVSFYNVQFQKISILPPWKVLCFAPPLHPGNSILASYFASKILTFNTPLPLGIPDDLPWSGYGFFLELHDTNKTLVTTKTNNCIKTIMDESNNKNKANIIGQQIK